MEPRRPLSRAELKKFSRPRASPKASVLDNFGDKRRTVRYLTFIYDKVSLDRP